MCTPLQHVVGGGHKAKGGVLLVLEREKSGTTFKMASQFFPYI